MVSRRQFLIGAQSALVSAGAMAGLCRCAGNLAVSAAALDRPDPELRAADGEVIATR
jgi:hypothetical protein